MFLRPFLLFTSISAAMKEMGPIQWPVAHFLVIFNITRIFVQTGPFSFTAIMSQPITTTFLSIFSPAISSRRHLCPGAIPKCSCRTATSIHSKFAVSETYFRFPMKTLYLISSLVFCSIPDVASLLNPSLRAASLSRTEVSICCPLDMYLPSRTAHAYVHSVFPTPASTTRFEISHL